MFCSQALNIFFIMWAFQTVIKIMCDKQTTNNKTGVNILDENS